jgi:hypothetical protein
MIRRECRAAEEKGGSSLGPPMETHVPHFEFGIVTRQLEPRQHFVLPIWHGCFLTIHDGVVSASGEEMARAAAKKRGIIVRSFIVPDEDKVRIGCLGIIGKLQELYTGVLTVRTAQCLGRILYDCNITGTTFRCGVSIGIDSLRGPFKISKVRYSNLVTEHRIRWPCELPSLHRR